MFQICVNLGKSPRKVSRPLSGCKKSRMGENVKADSQSEAQAVLEALRAENSRVSQYSQGKADTPRQQTQVTLTLLVSVGISGKRIITV